MKCTIILTLLFISFVSFAHLPSERLDDIRVIDHSEEGSLVDFIPSVTQIKGKELQKRRQTSIGEMLQTEAGVSSTYFGPSSSRPVIRGLEGERIRVLQNGLGTLDASSQSFDHAIPVDTLTIDQIEVVRGPMGLLYGSSAVGGVVNLVTNRIHTVYEEGFFSQVLLQGETVNNGLSSALQMNYGTNRWMFHVDGSTRNLGDIDLPGHVKGGSDEVNGKLPNSFNQQNNLAVGASHLLDRGHFGVSFNHFNTEYGAVAEEDVTIDMVQNRGEVHAEYRPESGLFRKIRLKSAQSSYEHKEMEGEETGTVFENKGNETRIEALNKSGAFEGVTGIQTQIFSFKATGEEAFLPTTDNKKGAIFTYQERTINEKNSLLLGGRLESAIVEKQGSADFGASDSRSFLGHNVSLGHIYKFSDKKSFSSSYSYTERAPHFQELYALGDHVASGSYEEGDSQLVKEKAHAFELSFKSRKDGSQFVFNIYTQVFKDFIALSPTGQTGNSEEGFPEFGYGQTDALFYGVDLEARQELAEWRKGVLTFVSTADFVRAKDTDTGDDLPRITPPRVSAGIEYGKDKWNADLEVQYVARQSKTAPGESRTESYTMANLGFMYNFVAETSGLSLFARVRNVFDVEARNHVSFIKDIAPLPGRNFVLGLQAQL